MYGFTTPVAVAVPVTVPPAVTSTNSIFQDVSVPPAVQLKSAEEEVTLEAVKALGSIQLGIGSHTTSSKEA